MDNFSSKFDSITFDNVITLHSSEIIKHRMQNGNLIFPMLPGDLETGIFDNCPYNIVKDHIQCWSAIDEKVAGVSMTTLPFSDGTIDYRPLNYGPKFLLCELPFYLHSQISDFHNKHFSGFIYLPESFRMGANRLQTIELTTCTTCIDHVNKLERIQQRGLYCTAEAYIHSKCTPLSNELSSIVVCDDNRQKVPRSNCSL